MSCTKDQIKVRSAASLVPMPQIKTAKRQEVVIAGFTAPRRSRPFFGALVLAVREGNAWRYIGHVGTGFTQDMLADLMGQMGSLGREESPFGLNIPAQVARGARWVEP